MSQANEATDAKSIKQLYDEGMQEVFKVVGSIEASDAQRDVALQTAEDLTSLLVKHTLATIDGRTALLAGLIVELNQVIEAVEEEPESVEVLQSVTKILGKAEKLFDKEKKVLT
jgi:hypothetical protein